MPINFTDREWKQYLDKIRYIKPMNDKEWEEYIKQLQLQNKNPNYEFYPNPPSFFESKIPSEPKKNIEKERDIYYRIPLSVEEYMASIHSKEVSLKRTGIVIIIIFIIATLLNFLRYKR